MPKIKAIFINVVLALGLLGGAIETNAVQQEVEEKRLAVRHANDFYKSFDRLHDDVKEMEASQRGYLLTGEKSYLNPYEEIKGSIPQDLLVCRSLVVSNKEKIIYDEFEKNTNEKTDELAKTIKLHEAGKHKESIELVKTDFGKERMETMSRITRNMRDKLSQTTQEYRRISDKRTYYLFVAAVFFVYCILTWVCRYVIEKKVTARNLAIADEIKKMQMDFEQKMSGSITTTPVDLTKPLVRSSKTDLGFD